MYLVERGRARQGGRGRKQPLARPPTRYALQTPPSFPGVDLNDIERERGRGERESDC